MRIGLIDVDGHNFPNLPLMKISAWHKKNGDHVEWYSPLFSGHMDKVYMSKIFSNTPDYPYYIDADGVIKGGSGYCIRTENGKEIFDKSKDIWLPKEGRYSIKVADLSEFWRGQKNIVLLDPNITACKDWKNLFQQLIDSKAWTDFSQGLDIRLMTEEKTDMLMRMKIKNIHFAWDNYKDKDIVIPKFKHFKEQTGLDKRKLTVYVLTNFNSTHEEDLERIYTLRELGYWPYVMVYNKDKLPKGHITRKLQRWVNMRAVFETIPRFEDYEA